MAWHYEHPHPAVTVDVAVFTIADGALEVLLVRRAREPFAGRWALPGGFVGIDESLKRAAWRELAEETGIRAGFLEQVGAFGRPDRDPRERVITIAYLCIAPIDRLEIRSGSDAADARLFDVESLPALAFDHAKILSRARARLREKMEEPRSALELLPEPFTLPALQRAHELVLGRPLDKRNFRKKILASGLVEPTGEQRRDGPHRPAALYRAAQR